MLLSRLFFSMKNPIKYVLLPAVVSTMLLSCSKDSTILYESDGSFVVFNGHVASVVMERYFGDERESIYYYFGENGRLMESVGNYPRIDTPQVERYSYVADSSVWVECCYPDGYTQTLVYQEHYDKNGRLVGREDEEQWGCNYTYDRGGHIVEVISHDEQGVEMVRDSYQYEHGRLIASEMVAVCLENASIKTTFEYDKHGHLVKEIATTPYGEEVTTYSDYVVDDHDNWLSRSRSDNHGSTTESREITYY